MSTLSPKGRALVIAGRRAFLPNAEDRTRMADRLRAQLGDAALPPGVDAEPPAPSAAAAAGRTAARVVTAMVVGAGIFGGVMLFSQPRGSTPPSVVDPGGSIAAPPPARAVTAERLPPDEPAAPPQAAASVVGPRQSESLAAEVALLSRATRSLHAGRPEQALRTLEEHRKRFPHGLLSEERRAARTQALCALGRFEQAKVEMARLTAGSALALRAQQACAGAARTP